MMYRRAKLVSPEHQTYKSFANAAVKRDTFISGDDWKQWCRVRVFHREVCPTEMLTMIKGAAIYQRRASDFRTSECSTRCSGPKLDCSMAARSSSSVAGRQRSCKPVDSHKPGASRKPGDSVGTE